MWNKELTDFFSRAIKELGIEPSNYILESFENYSSLLREWNERIKITAITEDRDIVIKHFIDSLTIAPFIDGGNITADASLIDVGTGGGFPGIPLKIVLNNLKVLLLDSVNKKVNFLNAVINELKLRDITAIHGRAEDLGHEILYREKFDYCTARAVARLPVLLEFCMPFLKTGGIFIAMKGSDISEINESGRALQLLGGEIIDVKKVFLPGLDGENMERNIIIIKKFRQTPTAYPRKAGKPTKSPII